jgi:uncharacterized protein YeaO (DUF488 family)
MIRLKRAYDPVEEEDGARFLVDRLWPRGVKEGNLQLDGWLKDAAPSDDLRRWYGHQVDRWEEFKARYFSELDEIPESLEPIQEAAKRGSVTLVYGARDRAHNNAVALREYLEMDGNGDRSEDQK